MTAKLKGLTMKIVLDGIRNCVTSETEADFDGQTFDDPISIEITTDNPVAETETLEIRISEPVANGLRALNPAVYISVKLADLKIVLAALDRIGVGHDG